MGKISIDLEYGEIDESYNPGEEYRHIVGYFMLVVKKDKCMAKDIEKAVEKYTLKVKETKKKLKLFCYAGQGNPVIDINGIYREVKEIEKLVSKAMENTKIEDYDLIVKVDMIY